MDQEQAGDIAARKSEHIDMVLHQDVDFVRSTGLERYEFRHEALPELTLAEIDMSVNFLGKRLRAPLLVSGMTGGTEQAAQINRCIAQAVERLGLGMGIGSQRIALERPELLATFQVREVAPTALLVANIGAVQLNYGITVADCRRLVEAVQADALAVHLNPLQEAIQPGGNTDFRGLEGKIAELCAGLPVPVIAKEVGCGISGGTAQRLCQAGVAAIDVGGAGGTCWAAIEARRSRSPATQALAACFREWGIPTAQAIQAVRQSCPAVALIASGGLRNGLEVAKCLGLGADLAAVAGPVLKAAVQSDQAVQQLLAGFIHQLRLAMFCTGSPRPSDLRRALHPVTP